MSTAELEARLAKVQAAINGILSGGAKSYDIDGQSVTKLDLEWLSREEDRLVARIARKNRRGGAFRQVVPK